MTDPKTLSHNEFCETYGFMTRGGVYVGKLSTIRAAVVRKSRFLWECGIYSRPVVLAEISRQLNHENLKWNRGCIPAAVGEDIAGRVHSALIHVA